MSQLENEESITSQNLFSMFLKISESLSTRTVTTTTFEMLQTRSNELSD